MQKSVPPVPLDLIGRKRRLNRFPGVEHDLSPHYPFLRNVPHFRVARAEWFKTSRGQIATYARFDDHGPVSLGFRHYQTPGCTEVTEAFQRRFCHAEAPIEVVGVWDTVKALGLRLPFLRRRSEPEHAFHLHHLGACVRRGYHALALDETRIAFNPVMWGSRNASHTQVCQTWFRGIHGDIGGQLGGDESARGLSTSRWSGCWKASRKTAWRCRRAGRRSIRGTETRPLS